MLALLLHALILKRESEAFSSYQKADLSGWRVWARPGVVMNITHTPTQEGEREEKGEREHGRRGFDLKWQMLMERANASANFHFFFYVDLFTEKVPGWKEWVFACVCGRGQGHNNNLIPTHLSLTLFQALSYLLFHSLYLYRYDWLFQCFHEVYTKRITEIHRKFKLPAFIRLFMMNRLLYSSVVSCFG